MPAASCELLDHIDNVHTTALGIARLKKNLRIDMPDAADYCKNKISDPACRIYRQGKNWYCEVDNIKITIHASSYTIITAHMTKQPG